MARRIFKLFLDFFQYLPILFSIKSPSFKYNTILFSSTSYTRPNQYKTFSLPTLGVARTRGLLPGKSRTSFIFYKGMYNIYLLFTFSGRQRRTTEYVKLDAIKMHNPLTVFFFKSIALYFTLNCIVSFTILNVYQTIICYNFLSHNTKLNV